ncbi:MAG: MerR family transcriptional regulator [Holophagales bacterium]|nr:MerR family transcriptional regulator [Holophagales bacterium]
MYTYPVDMNVTLSIDDRVVAEARRIAALRGTSLNQLVRDYLHELTRTDDSEAVVARLDALWAEESYGSERSWTREELHERS